MSGKVLLRIALALVLALLVWASLVLFHRTRQDASARMVLPRLNESQADRVVVYKGKDTIVMERQSGQWRTGAYPAAPGVLKELFTTLADTSVGSELVAESAGTHERMGVDSAKAKRLLISGGGKPLLELLVGNHGPDFEGYYVRRAGEAKVYLLNGRVGEIVDQRPDDWRNPQFAAVVSDSVAKIAIVRGRKSYAITKTGSGWSIGAGPADSTAVAHFLETVKDVRSSGYPSVAQRDSVNFKSPERRLQLSSASGANLLTVDFDSTSNAFWVRTDSVGPAYRVDIALADRLTPVDTVWRKR